MPDWRTGHNDFRMNVWLKLQDLIFLLISPSMGLFRLDNKNLEIAVKKAFVNSHLNKTSATNNIENKEQLKNSDNTREGQVASESQKDSKINEILAVTFYNLILLELHAYD